MKLNDLASVFIKSTELYELALKISVALEEEMSLTQALCVGPEDDLQEVINHAAVKVTEVGKGSGCRHVLVPGGVYTISKPLVVPKDVCVWASCSKEYDSINMAAHPSLLVGGGKEALLSVTDCRVAGFVLLPAGLYSESSQNKVLKSFDSEAMKCIRGNFVFQPAEGK